MKKINNRTHKESEEVIKYLQQKLWDTQKVTTGMRMALYYVNKHLSEIEDELDGLWIHHQDGSDLLVSKDELFDVIHNKILGKLRRSHDIINKPLNKLKDFIGW